MRKEMRNGWFIFVVILMLKSLFSIASDGYNASMEDPLVQEALKADYEVTQMTELGNWWLHIVHLLELRDQAKALESKAIISALISKYCMSLSQILPSFDSRLDIIVGPIPYWKIPRVIRDYFRIQGREQELLRRTQDGTWQELVFPKLEELRKIYQDCIKIIEEYDPDLSVAMIKVRAKDGDMVFHYSTVYKTKQEIDVWHEEVRGREAKKILDEFITSYPSAIRIVESKEGYLKTEFTSPSIAREYWVRVLRDIQPSPTWYFWLNLAYYYDWLGDYAKALYYQERYEVLKPILDVWDMVMLPEGKNLLFSDKLKDIRKKYISDLRSGNKECNLHPFLYITDKPHEPKKGFTKGGKPFVSADSFLKALNIPFEWTREGKLLTIKKEDGTMKIANIKDKWWIYKDGERKEVEGYIKDTELYLPLEELCELLNLKLEWDENTFIGKVFTK